MSLVWFLGGVLLIAIGTVCSVGAALPRDHVASGSAVVPASLHEVWGVITDVAGAPGWRSSVDSVDGIAGPAAAPTAWTERKGKDALPFALVRRVEDQVFETRIVDKGLPFGGTWTMELAPEGAGTRVTITERGFVRAAPFRFIARFFIGHKASLERYLTDLGARAWGGMRSEG